MMRLVIALSWLLWACAAQAVPMAQCADGQYWYRVSVGSSECPSQVTLTGSSTTTSAITITGTVSTLSGTVYASARLNCTEQQWRNIANGVGDESSGSDATVTDGTFSVTLSGLAEDTTYCIHAMQYAASKPTKTLKSEIKTADSTPAATGNTITGGDDWFYCSSDGSDAASGTSHANRKKNYPTTDASLSAGDDMWLCSGGLWEARQIVISRAGSTGNWSEFGCYYFDSPNSRKCLDGTRGAGAQHPKPEIRGRLTDLCIDGGTCLFPTTPPAGDNLTTGGTSAGYVIINHQSDYFDMRNIQVTLARYKGVVVQGNGTADSLRYVVLDGVDVNRTGSTMVVASNGISDLVIRNGDYYGGGLCSVAKARRISTDTSGCPTWPGGVQVTRKIRRFLIENNDVRRTYSEGISAYQAQEENQGWGIIRGNRVMNAHSSSIYLDGFPNVVVENNIAVGGNGLHYGHQGSAAGSFESVKIGSERSTFPNGIGHVVRNNLGVGAIDNFSAVMQPDVRLTSDIIGGRFSGNTSIAARPASGTYYEAELPEAAADLSEMTYTNNVHWNEAAGAAACTMSSAIVQADNHWHTDPSDADCDGPGDTTGNLALTDNTYANWTTVRSQTGESPDWPTFAEINPAGGSALIGSGTPLTAAILNVDNFGYAWQQIAEVLDLSLTEAEWEAENAVDALGATRANPPSKGAVE